MSELVATTIATLAAVIARSPIVVARPLQILPLKRLRLGALPAGFDEVDAAILHWIASEARHTRALHIH